MGLPGGGGGLLSLQADPDSGLRVGSCPGPGGGLSLPGQRRELDVALGHSAGWGSAEISKEKQGHAVSGRGVELQMNPPRVTSPMLLTQGDRP